MTDLPPGPFRCIVADPPWPYENAGTQMATAMVADGSRRQRTISEWDYPPMPMAEILALPVAGVTDDRAHLYLWVTNAFIAEGLEVMAAWGFRYVTMLTWAKMQNTYPPAVSMKAGYYFRGATEHVLFGVHGSLPPPDGLALPTAYLWPRLMRHSAKPHEFYRDVAEVMSPGPRLEMFARGERAGWTTWGDQVHDPDLNRLEL